jgi:hypothetical protein
VFCSGRQLDSLLPAIEPNRIDLSSDFGTIPFPLMNFAISVPVTLIYTGITISSEKEREKSGGFTCMLTLTAV